MVENKNTFLEFYSVLEDWSIISYSILQSFHLRCDIMAIF